MWSARPGASYDKAVAEAQLAVQGRAGPQQGPWKNINDLELAVAEHIGWFDHCPHGEIGLVRPADYEDNHYRHDHKHCPSVSSARPLNRHATLVHTSEIERMDVNRRCRVSGL